MNKSRTNYPLSLGRYTVYMHVTSEIFDATRESEITLL